MTDQKSSLRDSVAGAVADFKAGRTSSTSETTVYQPRGSGFGKSTLDRVIDEFDKGFPIAQGVDQENWLVVQPEQAPADDFEGFVKRADAAGEDGEGVGQLEHPQFSVMHAANDDELGERRMTDLQVEDVSRDDPGDPASRRQRRVGGAAHQSDATAAVDQANTRIRQDPPKAYGVTTELVPGTVG